MLLVSSTGASTRLINSARDLTSCWAQSRSRRHWRISLSCEMSITGFWVSIFFLRRQQERGVRPAKALDDLLDARLFAPDYVAQLFEIQRAPNLSAFGYALGKRAENPFYHRGKPGQ
jgi:hypothetical protein